MASVATANNANSPDWVAGEIAAIKSRVLVVEDTLNSLSATVHTNAAKLNTIDSNMAEILAVLKGARTVGGFLWTNWGKILSVIFAVATSQHWLNPTILAAIQQSFLPH